MINRLLPGWINYAIANYDSTRKRNVALISAAAQMSKNVFLCSAGGWVQGLEHTRPALTLPLDYIPRSSKSICKPNNSMC